MLPTRSLGFRRKVLLATTLATLVLASAPIQATTVTVTCGREDVVVVGWGGPLTITYDGEATGTLHVVSRTQEFSLPAHMEKQPQDVDGTQMDVVSIQAVDKTQSKMPDLPTLEACIAKTIPSGMEQDNDSYLNARDSCLSPTPINVAPIDIRASVKIAFLAGKAGKENGQTVELKRAYLSKTSAPGGITNIEAFPAQCAIDMK